MVAIACLAPPWKHHSVAPMIAALLVVITTGALLVVVVIATTTASLLTRTPPTRGTLAEDDALPTRTPITAEVLHEEVVVAGLRITVRSHAKTTPNQDDKSFNCFNKNEKKHHKEF